MRYLLKGILVFILGIGNSTWAEAGGDLEQWVKDAQAGSLEAQLKLAGRYYAGDGIDIDYANAREWYEKSGQQGSGQALFNLALMAEQGQGGPVDNDRAFYWFELATKNGYTKAHRRLGLLYLSGGIGLEKDYSKALRLLRLAARKDDGMAEYYLSAMYTHGAGVEKSPAVALKYSQESCEHGYQKACSVKTR